MAATTADGGAVSLRPALVFPEPIDYQRIWLEDQDAQGQAINYTDCMESSVLRFMQAVLCDPRSLSAEGVPTRVDLELVRRRVPHAKVRAYFERYPEILPAGEYNGFAFQARQEWARLVTRRPFFTYKRATTGVYKNHALEGKVDGFESLDWQLELEPCIHNIISMFRHFLGVSFAEVDHKNMPWTKAGEAHCFDVTEAAQGHFDVAMRQLSRPDMALQCRLDCERAGPRIDIAVNGQATWQWRLKRIFLKVADEHAGVCALDDKGKQFFITSAHSEIKGCYRAPAPTANKPPRVLSLRSALAD